MTTIYEHHTAEVVNPEGDFPVLLLCEHANNRLPVDVPAYLDMDQAFLDSYHGYDLGIPHVARRCAYKLGATLVAGVYSRLLIDLNRHLGAEDLFKEHDDGIEIPANKGASDDDIQHRINTYYHPYHEICEKHRKRLQKKYTQPVMFSMHSFPRHQTGYEAPFPWHFTLHYNSDERVANIVRDYLEKHHTDLHIGNNEPYDLKQLQTGGGIIHGEDNGLPNLLIEIPNDQMTTAEQVAYWADICTNILREVTSRLEEKSRFQSAI